MQVTQFSKQVARALFALGLGVATACSKTYDDAPLRERIDKVEGIVSSAEARVAALSKDMEAIRQLVNAIKNRNEITSVKEQRNSAGEITSYTISFVKGSDVTIRMGSDGSDAVPPQISIFRHSDGHYYWQVGSQPLRDSSGQMYRADGDNGKTPRVRIEGNEWQASYNDGQSWVSLGPAKGPKGAQGAPGPKGPKGTSSGGGDSLFESIDHRSKGGFVIFKLRGSGQTFSVPRQEELQIRFDVPEGTIFSHREDHVYEIPFTIVGDITGLQLYLDNDWFSHQNILLQYREGERSGKVHLKTVNEYFNDTAIILVALRGDRKYVFTLGMPGGYMRVATRSVHLSGLFEDTGETTLKTNVDYKVEIPAEDRDWLSVADTRVALRHETLRFTAKTSELLVPRRSWVRLTDAHGNELEYVVVTQSPGEIPDAAIEVPLGQGKSFWALYSEFANSSASTEGGYLKFYSHVDRLKITGTPTANDWKDMYFTFRSCRILDLSESNIKVIEANTFTDGSFEQDQIEYIIFPPGLQRIESNAFSNQRLLRKVSIPVGAMVAPDAFSNTPYKTSRR